MSLDASAYPGLAVGDHVRIEINRASPYLAVWLMLAQPLVLLVAGIFVGMKLGAAILGEGWKGLSGVACAILLVALNYAVVAWLDRRFFSVRRAHARIVDIIP
jgi:positive regulator of sigma E activity